jgi:ferritin-like metal-binding protein YciE
MGPHRNLYELGKPGKAPLCPHFLVRKGYYLGLDTEDYVCVVCGMGGPTKDWPSVAASAEAPKKQLALHVFQVNSDFALTSTVHLPKKDVIMATPKENLLDWLRDAHAMEQQAEKMLKAQSERLEHYPQLKARIDQHIQETLGQQKLVDECLTRLGGSSSTLKDLTGKLMAFGQAVGGSMMSDEVIKGAMAGYVFENVEIATYTALIAAAKAAGDPQTQAACEQILPQEQAMAAWLLEHLPEITEAFLVRSADPDLEAKR